ncbi:MAG TPA: winged helix-turn-helix domain-containing protein [Rhodanobacteraceae bacterium]|nr:winged helix-turn-helix domain-containing protein [Rhodanobacteraceae bacterium]
MAETIYRFGAFRVSTAKRELHEGDAVVDLPARAFDCLVYLIEHRQRAVGRDELIAAVWGRADVSEALLNHTILRIRRSLGAGGAERIRTVPRFGYRWVCAVEPEEIATVSPMTERASESGGESQMPPRLPARATAARRRAAWPLAILFAIAALGIYAIVARTGFVARIAATLPTPAADDADEKAGPVQPALVLPAEIDAAPEWRWLRFGVMDLVANQLRGGALPTAPSESVVALLRQRASADGDALLADPALKGIAAMRVLPRVRADRDRWHVRLDAAGMQQTASVEAEAADPIAAAREAANRLLARLGHRPGTPDAATSPELAELMQRSGAAMLADQLDDARRLIESAPAALRESPPAQQRIAQIELRAGEYDAVERRLLTLIDRLDPKRDAALRARALITLASSYVRRDAFEKADEAYAEAIALRGNANDPEVLGLAYLGRGIALAQHARFDEASAALGRARIELETAGDVLGVAQVDVNLGDFLVMRHRPADALPMLDSAAQRFERLGAREGLVYTLVEIARVEGELLDPAAALAATERFWPPEAHTSNPRMQWIATRARIEALASNGRLAEAAALVERVRAEADPARDAALRTEVGAIAARIALARGDRAGALRLADAALTAGLLKSDRLLYARTLSLKGAMLREGGALADAGATVAELRDLAASSGDEAIALAAALADADQDRAENRRDAALRDYAAAMQRAARLDVPAGLVAVGAHYVEALIEASHLDEARSVGGRLAPWADRDLSAAWVQVQLYRALDSADAERNALAAATRLAGDGALPDAPRAPAGAPGVR